MSTAGHEAYLAGQTKTSQIKFVVGSKLTNCNDVPTELTTHNRPDVIAQELSSTSRKINRTLWKNVALFTSLETTADLMTATANELHQASFQASEQHSDDFWQDIWHNADIQIDGDLTSQKLTRVNIFHTFVSATQIANQHLDASVGARGLHGEAYRGHVFGMKCFIPFIHCIIQN